MGFVSHVKRVGGGNADCGLHKPNLCWSYGMMSNYMPISYEEVITYPWHRLDASLTNVCQ